MTKNNLFVLVSLGAVLLCQVVVRGEDCIDPKQHAQDIKNCCDIPCPVEMDNIDQCAKNYANLTDKAEQLICVVHCHAGELGVSDGKAINKDKLMELVNKITDKPVRDLANKAAEECLAVLDEIIAKSNEIKGTCSALGFMFLECLTRAIYGDCPDNHWKKSETCDKIKQGVKVCP